MKLKIFDYLGSVFGFTYDESMRLQTNCGGILSLMLTLLSVIIITSMGVSLFDKSHPFNSKDREICSSYSNKF